MKTIESISFRVAELRDALETLKQQVALLKRRDGRHIATATTIKREDVMASLLNGTLPLDAPLTMFPCPPDTVRNFRATFLQKIPNPKSTVCIGGLGKHYDLETVTDTTVLHGELKVTASKPSPIDTLAWRPWKDTVQFLQAQLKSKIAKSFLGACGDPMLTAWFDSVVKPFSETLPAAAGMTCAGYVDAMFDFGMAKEGEAAAKTFIKALRADASIQSALHAKWLEFETHWFSSHTMNHEKLKDIVKEIIEAKDYWVCVSNTHIHWIDGLKVDRLDYIGARPKPKGGMSFHYTLTLRQGAETKQVPMECKFHWKNGGQAVQNLNLMLL